MGTIAFLPATLTEKAPTALLFSMSTSNTLKSCILGTIVGALPSNIA